MKDYFPFTILSVRPSNLKSDDEPAPAPKATALHSVGDARLCGSVLAGRGTKEPAEHTAELPPGGGEPTRCCF